MSPVRKHRQVSCAYTLAVNYGIYMFRSIYGCFVIVFYLFALFIMSYSDRNIWKNFVLRAANQSLVILVEVTVKNPIRYFLLPAFNITTLLVLTTLTQVLELPIRILRIVQDNSRIEKANVLDWRMYVYKCTINNTHARIHTHNVTAVNS